MKGTQQFKEVIEGYLSRLAGTDELFAETFKKPNKNIDDCITYIFNTVKESGACGFSDDEVFQMAVHYYDEDDIKVGGPVHCNVVVNHKVEISDAEKEKAKKEAINQLIAEEKDRLKKKDPKKTVQNTEQASLF